MYFYTQRGMVLIMTLILLTILTVIATGGMRTMILQEQISSNTKNYDLAFQSAETALRDAEAYINALIDVGNINEPFFIANNGMYWQADPDNITDIDFFDTAWSSEDSVEYRDLNGILTSSVSDNQLYTLPRYMIEYLGERLIAGAVDTPETSSYNEGETITTLRLFRITARGVGGSSDTEVILQTLYNP